MIIKLTLEEVRTFVATVLNRTPHSFDLEIVNPDTSLLSAFRRVVNRYPGCRSYDKISAIKRFRELVPKGADGYSCVGLADAKWAVENPITTLANLERTGNIRG